MAMGFSSLLQRRAGAARVCAAPKATHAGRGRLVIVSYKDNSAPPPATETSKITRVQFKVPYHVEFGQEVCLLGEAEGLGQWQVEQAVPMIWSEGDVWTAKAEVPAGSRVQYKYIIRASDTGKVLQWQPCENLEVAVPEASEVPLVVEDAWEGPQHVVIPESKPTVASEPETAAKEGPNSVEEAVAMAVELPAFFDAPEAPEGEVAPAPVAAAAAAEEEEEPSAPAIKVQEDTVAPAAAAAADTTGPTEAQAPAPSKKKASNHDSMSLDDLVGMAIRMGIQMTRGGSKKKEDVIKSIRDKENEA